MKRYSHILLTEAPDADTLAKWHEIVDKERKIETGLASFVKAQDHGRWIPDKEKYDISLETEQDYVHALAYAEGMIKRHKDEIKILRGYEKKPATAMEYGRKHGISGTPRTLLVDIRDDIRELTDQIKELTEWKASLKWSYTRAKTQLKRQGNLFDAPAPTKAHKTLAPKSKVATPKIKTAAPAPAPKPQASKFPPAPPGYKPPLSMVYADYKEAHNTAILYARYLGKEVGIEKITSLQGKPEFKVIHLPDPKNRYGHELKAQVVRPDEPLSAGPTKTPESVPTTQAGLKTRLLDHIVYLEKDAWKVVAVGAVSDGKVYLHLASTTRATEQRNGQVPVQMADWFEINFVVSRAEEKHAAPKPTPEPEIKPHGGSKAPRLGNTAKEVWDAWKALPCAATLCAYGKGVMGPEFFWSGGELRASIRAKNGLATYKVATKAQEDEVFRDIETGQFQIYYRAPSGIAGHGSGSSHPMGTRVVHQATGHPLEAKEIAPDLMKKFRSAAAEWAHHFLADQPHQVSQVAQMKIVDYLRVHPHLWGAMKFDRIARTAIAVSGMDIEPKEASDHKPDQAVVNVPLGKRGNIDAQLDKYKKDQAAAQKADAKTKAAVTREAKVIAKELFAKYGEALVNFFMSKNPTAKRAEVRKTIDGMVKWQPERAISMFQKFEKELKKKLTSSSQDIIPGDVNKPSPENNVMTGKTAKEPKAPKAQKVVTTFHNINVTVTPIASGAEISFPKEMLPDFKAAFPTRKFDWDRKVWSVPGVQAFGRLVKWAETKEKGEISVQKQRKDATQTALNVIEHFRNEIVDSGAAISSSGVISFNVLTDDAVALFKTLPNATQKTDVLWYTTPHSRDDVQKILSVRAKIKQINQAFLDSIKSAKLPHGASVEGRRISYTFPKYNADAVAIIRTLPNRSFSMKTWTFVITSRHDLEQVVNGITKAAGIIAANNQAEHDASLKKVESDHAAGKGSYIELASRAPAVGSTFRRGGKIVTVTEHGRRYRADDDTSSLGGPVGAEGEWVVPVHYRAATEAETIAFETKEQHAKSAADQARTRQTALAVLRKSNDAPHLGHVPAGELIWKNDSQALYGHEVKVILTHDGWLWHVTYDGSDGAAWGEYNLGHNTRGSRTKATSELIAAIRDTKVIQTSHSPVPVHKNAKYFYLAQHKRFVPKFPYEVLYAFSTLEEVQKYVESELKNIETGWTESDIQDRARLLASMDLVISDTKIGVGKHVPAANVLQWQKVETFATNNIGKRLTAIIDKIEPYR